MGATTAPAAAPDLAQVRERMTRLQQGARFAPGELEVLYKLGLSHWTKGAFDEAAAVFRNLVLLSPGNTRYLLALALADRAANRPAQALQGFLYLHLLDPQPTHQVELADCLLRMRKPAQAVQVLDAVLVGQHSTRLAPEVLERAQGLRAIASRSTHATA